MKRMIWIAAAAISHFCASALPQAQQFQQTQQGGGQPQNENQQAAAPGVLHAQSDLVRLDVEVTYKSGNSVKGLHANVCVA